MYFDPPCAVPARFPSPFATPPHPLACHAADALRERIRDLPSLAIDGKMFGVLVVADRDGRIGALHGFSGMLDGRWHVEGFVPPLFDAVTRDRVWPAGEAELDQITAQLAALERSAAGPAAELVELDRSHAAALVELRARHREQRAGRRAARDATTDPQALHALDQASRGDAAEKRRLLHAHATARTALANDVAVFEARRRELAAHRAERSRQYLIELFDTYEIANARGERASLRAVFAPDEPPGGTGDCAAPKLLGHAYRLGLRPLALAELWWGAPPATGGRHAGVFYPACRGKCGPLLAYMLDGLEVEPPPVFGTDAPADAALETVFEDAWLAIVNKPAGMLSVPGRSAAVRDSVQTRLAARYREAHLVHRLDLDVSGLLLVAKDRGTHAVLQQAFADHKIEKHYLAWLAGLPSRDGGTIELALRVDVDDRPRQIYDPVHGKPAVTEWRVISRVCGRALVAMVPRTGRTHQLRVHAAHPLGIGVPIVGDRLYGQDAPRLLLHAATLSFVHPHTKKPLVVACEAPF
jgi:tRNA pseudouridine32 synthase/23S rRNA pseudouridine746 synthase